MLKGLYIVAVLIKCFMYKKGAMRLTNAELYM